MMREEHIRERFTARRYILSRRDMKKILLALLLLFGSVGTGFAQTGWIQVTGTALQPSCPSNTSTYAFSDNCRNVVNAWSGGIADTKRNRLLIFGGGHTDYSGNEVYSFDGTIRTRLNNPSSPNLPSSSSCPAALSDGNPNSRHTYGGLAYIASVDKMFVFGGSLACAAGNSGGDTWTLDLATLAWKRMDPTAGGHPTDNLAASADYDPNTGLVFL